jgi:ATP-dependent helicase/nuclease subunit B
MKSLVIAFDAQSRRRISAEFLQRLANQEALLVAATRGAADELVREVCAQTGTLFGVHRFTLVQLAIEAATKRLVGEGKSILAGVAVDALAARAVYECRKRDALDWFDSVAKTPGFFRALASTLSELRINSIKPNQLEQSSPSGGDLANLLREYSENLDHRGLADAASIYATAIDAIRSGEFPPGRRPILFLDVAPNSQLEQEFIVALARESNDVLATAHARDENAIRIYSEALNAAPTRIDPEDSPTALGRLRRHVFEVAAPPAAAIDATVDFVSATDENRECVEIARSILDGARSGTAFDRMAVLLRNPDLYQPLLEDSFRRACIPAFFTRGTRRPNTGGRAFLTLLACAAEKLSASRFSEYLSLGQLPDIAEPVPPAPSPPQHLWVAAQGELFTDLPPLQEGSAENAPAANSESPIIAGTLRSPRHWERLLVDAAVIGGHDRWVRRLEGLRKELGKRIQELAAEEEPVRLRMERDLEGLADFQSFALPIVKFLNDLPQSAMWSDWLERLEQLAQMAIRQPQSVLSVLAELRPMSTIGPVTLDEVWEALSDRLTFLRTEPVDRRYGKVFVATIPEVSGLSFDSVFLPGLGEDILPKKTFEDPLLLDDQRAAVSSQLPTQHIRVRRERMLLHIAASAAASRLWISYPRMDLAQGRARGPSFYALDVLRAVTGEIPELRALEQRAAETSQSQIGWPAPRSPAVAIDDSEYDLAVISAALRKPTAEVRGAGRYLVEASPGLARSLRARWSRWEKSWSPYDGIHLQAGDAAFPLLQQHRLTARPYSATALQQFAMCPYRFALYSICKLQPRDEISTLERLEPLTRGHLFHTVQFRLLSRLRSLDMLPIADSNQARVLEITDQVLNEVADIYSEELKPAIPRVWESEIEEVRWDLRGWIRQIVLAPDNLQWKPTWFELAFGLRHGGERDPDSSPNPITMLNGMQLRGAIDMIDENSGHIRITDHKTGKLPPERVQFIGKGEVLQPLLYAEAAQSLLGKIVDHSRLSYCTENGGYQTIEVPIDDESREVIRRTVNLIDHSIGSGFLPAAPRKKACEYCDYHIVCGPYEELRVRRKPLRNLASLHELREIP